MLAIRRAPADHDTPAWFPRSVILWLDILMMDGILWLYQIQGLLMICAPNTDVTKNSYDGYTWTAGHEKKGGEYMLP